MSTDKKYFSQISNFIKNKFEGWELSIEVDGGRKDKPAIIYLENKNLKINFKENSFGS